MSRLIVKNLPKSITEARLREIFSEKGVITDVKLKYTKSGEFRRFGFVGFKSQDEAEQALEYFDKSCIDTTRISVELCAGLGDTSKPKSWSKYAKDSEAFKKLHEKEEKQNISANEPVVDKPKKSSKTKEEKSKIAELLAKHKNDPLFNEFMESHTGTKTKMMWENDAVEGLCKTDETNVSDNDSSDKEEKEEADSAFEEEEEEGSKKEKIADKKVSDLEYMKALQSKKESTEETKEDSKKEKSAGPAGHGPVKFYTVTIRGLGFNHKKKHIKQLLHPLKPKSIRIPPKIKGVAYVGFKMESHMRQALKKNKSFLEGKRIFVAEYTEKTQAEKTIKEIGEARWKKQQESLQNEESIAESGRIFLRNLSYTTSEEDVRNLFEKYGPLSEVDLPIDKATRKPKGFGTVTFVMPEHAAKAFATLDGSILNGRMLHLLPGKAKETASDSTPENGDGLKYKDKKELERKATAGSSHNWNTLFLGQNAVAEAIAANYGTTKEKLLEDGGASSVAVRLALGETQLVQETRTFLQENGVRLDAFNQPPEKRSKNVILVKNLPSGTLVHEVTDKFSPFGQLARVVMPPSGISALVEFVEPSEARKAFAKLAYTKFKHMPLYLEWAPDNAFTEAAKKPDKQETFEKKEVERSRTEEDDEPEPDTTLFVKNLNFSTSDESLKEHFSKCGKVAYANVATKKDPNSPANKLSMGYGFVRYMYKSDADRALKELQMTVLDGKTLELKRSERLLSTEVATTRKTSKLTAQTGTKILVRNIPFQANANEIMELFKAFGEIKGVRLPKKLVGVEKHRGFAFIEYFSKSDAKRAFEALCQSTHLYGRRLVLEWAKSEEDVDDIRKRTAKHFHQENPSSRSKRGRLDPESVGLSAE